MARASSGPITSLGGLTGLDFVAERVVEPVSRAVVNAETNWATGAL